MKKIFKYMSSVLAIAAVGMSLTACDDWTEPKSIDTTFGTMDTADPAAYAKYLENLREYRLKDHKKIYVWLNNTEAAFGSQGDRISAIPDSVDVVVLNAFKATNQIQAEMKKMREEKGMTFSYCISYTDMKANWTLLCENLAAKRLEFEAAYPDTPIPAELQDPTFIDYMAEEFTEQLGYFHTVGFDALMFEFNGKGTIHLTPAELAEYNSQALLFLGVIANWHERNPQIPIDYMGKPQNISGSEVLNIFRMVFFSESLNATNINAYTQCNYYAEGLIADSKVGMLASMRAIDNSEDRTGYFSNNTLAMDGLATWTAAHNVGAAGLMNVQNDYYVSNGYYTLVRKFIQTINPAAK